MTQIFYRLKQCYNHFINAKYSISTENIQVVKLDYNIYKNYITFI